MNIDTKILSKILASWIQQYKKELFTITKRDLSEECKGGLISENQLLQYSILIELKKKRRHDHLNICRKGIWQNPTNVYGKNTQQTRRDLS